MEIDKDLVDVEGYLARMAKPLQEKLRIAYYVPKEPARILDVGCADGTITRALADIYPASSFRGIDLNEEFVTLASEHNHEKGSNLSFEQIYLRELLARKEKYDAVLFVSVLHEFFSYGEGISSVLKALADAHELLIPGGTIIIRDMILPEYTKHNHLSAASIAEKIRAVQEYGEVLSDFEKVHGSVDTTYTANHFLLKYWYADNWKRECPEHYVPVTLEQYEQVFALLGMELIHRESYRLPFLEEKWRNDFGLDDHEIAELTSTSILIARKV